MRRRHTRINRWVLVGLAVLALFLFWFVSRSARYYRTRFYKEKLASVRLSARAFEMVRQYRQELGIPIDTVNDPNMTGLVGVQYSQLTYGRSDLSDALTTCNPNFSAAVLEMLTKAGVRAGDRIGVSWDGTYPGLNIQVLAVAHSLGIDPVIITAQSAGMWGANYPGLTWLDIEKMLRSKGLWTYKTRFATLGAESDDGRGLSPEGRMVLAAAADWAGVNCFIPRSFEQAVEQRLDAFKDVKAVISVGRVIADIGDPMARVPSRVLAKPITRTGPDGVIAGLLEKGIPVVYLGNPSRVAIDYRLPVAPVPLPEKGKGRLFFEKRYSVVLAAVFAIKILILLWLIVRYDIEWYLGDRKARPQEEAV